MPKVVQQSNEKKNSTLFLFLSGIPYIPQIWASLIAELKVRVSIGTDFWAVTPPGGGKV